MSYLLKYIDQPLTENLGDSFYRAPHFLLLFTYFASPLGFLAVSFKFFKDLIKGSATSREILFLFRNPQDWKFRPDPEEFFF